VLRAEQLEETVREGRHTIEELRKEQAKGRFQIEELELECEKGRLQREKLEDSISWKIQSDRLEKAREEEERQRRKRAGTDPRRGRTQPSLPPPPPPPSLPRCDGGGGTGSSTSDTDDDSNTGVRATVSDAAAGVHHHAWPATTVYRREASEVRRGEGSDVIRREGLDVRRREGIDVATCDGRVSNPRRAPPSGRPGSEAMDGVNVDASSELDMAAMGLEFDLDVSDDDDFRDLDDAQKRKVPPPSFLLFYFDFISSCILSVS
jgi:hypothetical protein